MAIGDAYALTLNQSYGANGKPLQNVFTYVQTAGTGGASELATAFEDVVLTEINPIQSDHIKNVSIRVINLFSFTDFITISPTVEEGGAVGVDTLARTLALNFSYRLNRRDVRTGSKRIAGLPEAAVTNGVVTDATYITAINNLRDTFNDNIASGGSTFQPVVIQRVWVEPDPPDHNGYYRLPTTIEELEYAGITAVLVNLDMSTQTSRK